MEDKDHLLPLPENRPQGYYGAVDDGRSVVVSKPEGVSNTLKLLFFICGLSVFARSEALFMQTQMYAKCFGLGPNFYAAASSALFMPGIVVQMIQTKYDRHLDRKFGTYRAAAYRIVLAYAST